MVDRALTVTENLLASVSLMVIAGVALMNVVTRYFLNASLAFTSEIAVNLAVWMTMIGAAIAVRERAHLGFPLLHQAVRGRVHAALTVLITLIVCAFLLVLVFYGWDQVASQRANGRTTPSMGIPQWWFSLALPVGAALAIGRAIQGAVSDIRSGGQGAYDLEGGVTV